MPPRNRNPLLVTIVLLLLFASPLAVGQKAIPYADDLQKLAKAAKQKKLPIVLLISQYHCGYCDRMKQELLNPMHFSGDFEETALVAELMIDEGEMVIDFQGNRVPAAEFSQRYAVYVTPTLLFLDSRGDEAAERILGINTLDFLMLYILDAAESAALQIANQ
jgi:thioredoxin-related protein